MYFCIQIRRLTKIAKRTAFSLICLIGLTTSAFPQAISQDEIEQAVEVMRQSGTPEETIKQFLESMAQANAFQENIQSHQEKGLSKEEAAMRASGMDETDIETLQGMTGLLGQLDAAAKAQKLKSEIAEFDRLHGEKNDVSVTVGTLSYELKLLECNYSGDTYYIQAGGPPKETTESGELLDITRSGPYAGGDNGQFYYIESLRFKGAEIEFYKDAIDVAFDGRTFHYAGETSPTSETEEPQSFQISLQCS